MKKHLPFVLAVFVLACAVYANCLPNDFNLDDVTIIRDNSLIESLRNLPRIFVSNYWANTPFAKGVLLYRPLAMATFALDYALWGNAPWGFHLTNLLLNGLVVVLLLLLLIQLFGDRANPAALALCALLYAFHPVHTEAVNMVVGRTELLAALFGFLAFLCHLRKWTMGAAACLFLALLSKEIAVTVPVMIFCYEWLFQRERSRRPYFVYAAVLGGYLVIRFAVLGGLVALHQSGILAQQSPAQRFLTVLKVLGGYLKLLVMPYPLTPDDSDTPLPHSLFEADVALPLAFVIALFLLAWRVRRERPAVTCAILWFFVSILPVSNIISIGAFTGERFLYLPSACLPLLLAGVLGQTDWGVLPLLPRRRGLGRGGPSPVGPNPVATCSAPGSKPVENTPAWRNGSLIALVAACGVFGAMTFNRNFDWRNATTLWTKVQARQPDNPRANFHLGLRAEEAKDYQLALGFYERAIRHYPNHNWNPDSRSVATVKERISNLCYVLSLRLYREEKFAEADTLCRRALENNESNAAAHVVMGNLYVQSNNLARAAESYATALRLNPDLFEAKENLRRVKEFRHQE